MEISSELESFIKNDFDRMKDAQNRQDKKKAIHRLEKDKKRKEAEREAEREADKIIKVYKGRAEFEYSILKMHKGKTYTEEDHFKYMKYLDSHECAKKVRNSILSKSDLKNANEGKENFYFNWWVYGTYSFIKRKNLLNKNADIYRWISNFLEEKKYHTFYTPETLKHIVHKCKKRVESASYLKSFFDYPWGETNT